MPSEYGLGRTFCALLVEFLCTRSRLLCMYMIAGSARVLCGYASASGPVAKQALASFLICDISLPVMRTSSYCSTTSATGSGS